MKTLNLLAAITIIALSFSCSSDSDNNTQNSTFLTKTVEFSPQSAGFTYKNVSHYLNNKKANDSIFNGSGTLTERRTYVYTSNTTTISRYNAANALLGKRVLTYDSSQRVIESGFYNGSEQLTYSYEYVYQGHDILVNKTENGSTDLYITYKTNNDDLIYYEQYTGDDVKTLSYANDKPTEIVNPTYTIPLEFYPIPKPTQRTTNEINSSFLTNSPLIIDHMYFHCNYYLKKATFPTLPVSDVNYISEFNTDNYQTHMRVFISDGVNPESNQSEKFFYYE